MSVRLSPKLGRPLAPRGGNDCVMTPPSLAAAIIAHFKPTGALLDPCRGTGAFYDAFPSSSLRDWCEITQGRDFLTRDFAGERYAWTITNPPWSQIRPFLARAMKVSDNVVYLCLVNAFWMKARLADMRTAGFGIREILLLDTPPKPWPQTGFQLGATHIQRGWKGDIRVSDARSREVAR